MARPTTNNTTTATATTATAEDFQAFLAWKAQQAQAQAPAPEPLVMGVELPPAPQPPLDKRGRPMEPPAMPFDRCPEVLKLSGTTADGREVVLVLERHISAEGTYGWRGDLEVGSTTACSVGAWVARSKPWGEYANRLRAWEAECERLKAPAPASTRRPPVRQVGGKA